MTTIYCVHTITGLEETFTDLIHETLTKEVKVHHISDESIIRRVLANGGLSKDLRRRFFENIRAAEDAGADIVQVTCSSVTPAIPCARQLVDVPVFSIDEPMARKAVGEYEKIGVMATNPGTLNPSTELLHSTAQQMQRRVDVSSILCKGAYDALLSGDRQKHDEIVVGYFKELMKKVDVVVLAQASMAGIIDGLEEKERHVPVLTSPGLAVEALARYVDSL
jgi:Asp/Glu/hydantoin racemase